MRAARRFLSSASAVALLAFCVLWPRAAAAKVQRYALVVGVNTGLAKEEPLRFAETDVDAVAETLETVGGYRSDRIVRLKNADAERVRNAIWI